MLGGSSGLPHYDIYMSHKPMYKVNEDGFDKVCKKAMLHECTFRCVSLALLDTHVHSR